MKNIINFDIDFSKIPSEVKKFFYIHNDIYRTMPIDLRSNSEKMVEIKNSEIICEPFWNDEILFTGNKEIDDLLNLEAIEMQNYINKNDGKFGIFVRKTVKKKLLKIDKKFRKKWYFLALKIWYRPMEVQKNLFDKVFEFYSKKNPNLDKEKIYDMTIEMISDPTRNVSPHTTGGAIDVVLYHKNKTLVDMGCPVNYIGEEANITSEKISAKHRKNREILQKEFLKEGFSCLASEWWHFSYGDPYWAKFRGKKRAKYGAI